VDHVRTIHYILLAFCIAFLFLSKTNPINVYERARDDLRWVVRVNDYLSEDWAKQTVPKVLSRAKQAQATPGVQSYGGSLVFDDRARVVALGPIWISVSRKNFLPESKAELNKAFPAWASSGNTLSSNLEEFAAAWDSMHDTTLVYLLDITGRGFEIVQSTQLKGKLTLKPIHVSSSQALPSPETTNPTPYLVLGTTKEQLTAAWNEIADYFDLPDTPVPETLLSDFKEGKEHISPGGTRGDLDGHPCIIVGGLSSDDKSFLAYIVEGRCGAVAVGLQTLFFRDRADVAARVNQGRYDDSFSSLSSVTKNLKEVSFEALDSHLHSLSNMSVDYDVFGIKLSAELITRWGVLVVLVTQVYLLIYIRELVARITFRDKGWQKAWIGTHRTRVSQLLFVLTITALPWIVVGTLSEVHLLPNFHGASELLAKEGIWVFDNHGSRILQYLSVLASVVASIWTLASWRRIGAMSVHRGSPHEGRILKTEPGVTVESAPR
jgi:hypothetical protein